MEGNSPENDQVRKLKQRICELELKKAENEVVLKHLRDENIRLRLAVQNCSVNSENESTLDSTELANVKEQLNESNARVSELLDQLKASKQENEGLKLLTAEVKERDEQISDLQRKLDAYESTGLETGLIKVTESNNNIAVQNFQTQLDESKQKITELEQKIAKSQRAKELADSNVVELKKQTRVTIHRNVRLCGKSELLQQEIQKLNKEAEDKALRVKEIFNLFDPSNAQRNQFVAYLFWQGMRKFNEKQYEDAVEFYLKMIEVEMSGRADSKQLSSAWGAISVCYHEMKKFESALEAAESALQYNPSDPFLFYSRGVALEELGYQSEAITSYTKVIELNSNDSCAEGAMEALIELGDE